MLIELGVNLSNKDALIKIASNPGTIKVTEKLRKASYSFVEDAKRSINIDPAHFELNLTQFFEKYRCSYNQWKRLQIINEIFKVRRAGLISNDSEFKSFIIQILYWLYKYEPYSSSANLLADGSIIGKYEPLYFDILTRIGVNVIIVYDKDPAVDDGRQPGALHQYTFQSVFQDIVEVHSYSKMQKAGDPIYQPTSEYFDEVFTAKTKTSQEVVTSDDLKNEDVPSFKLLFFPRDEVRNVDDLIHSMEQNRTFRVFISGHKDDRNESLNDVFNIIHQVGIENCQQLQMLFDGDTPLNWSDSIKEMRSGFRKFGTEELKRMPLAEQEHEIRRTAYELSKRLTNEKFALPYRYVIEQIFKKKEQEINNLYSVAIQVAAELNLLDERLDGRSTIVWFNRRHTLAGDTEVLIRIISMSELSCVFIDFFKESISLYKENIDLIEYPNKANWNEQLELPNGLIKVKLRTVASKASHEMDKMLYNGDALGMYKADQFECNTSIVLSSTIEEVSLMWQNDLVVRPGFRVANGEVTVPTIFANFLGVGNQEPDVYLSKIQRYVGPHVYFMRSGPLFPVSFMNPTYYVDKGATENVINQWVSTDGVHNVNEILKYWKYTMLPISKQRMMIQKIDEMCRNLWLLPTAATVSDVARVVNTIPQQLIQEIAWFDYTKRSPKIVYLIENGSYTLNQQDALALYFCNLIGFDIVVFVPTAYSSVERYLSQDMFETHKLGEPRFDIVWGMQNRKKGFFESLFS